MSYNDQENGNKGHNLKHDWPVEVFISYSFNDEEVRVKLEQHLMFMQREGIVRIWHGRKILPGQEWEKVIDSHLETASIVLLLVTPDFIASDYCYDIEMKRAMRRYDLNECFVIPIIICDTDWHSAPFGKLQSLPSNSRAVKSWSNIDEALSDVARGIRNAIKGLPKKISAVESRERLVEKLHDIEKHPSTALRRNITSMQIQHISGRIEHFTKVINTVDPLFAPDRYEEIKLRIEIYLKELEQLEQRLI
ncbi:MAG: toll/interleukin-1 receptor domain-containing protein [Nitrospirae bacterium]|nr:toll/interleukin-1 receptor domain-containing protein [Nitrospirota bacterium]